MTEAEYHQQLAIKDWSYFLILPMILLAIMIILGKFIIRKLIFYKKIIKNFISRFLLFIYFIQLNDINLDLFSDLSNSSGDSLKLLRGINFVELDKIELSMVLLTWPKSSSAIPFFRILDLGLYLKQLMGKIEPPIWTHLDFLPCFAQRENKDARPYVFSFESKLLTQQEIWNKYSREFNPNADGSFGKNNIDH